MLGLQQQLQDATELMNHAQHIVALTGAGISTESGIPDFRSPGSIWQQLPPVSYQDFISKPEARQQYWQTRSKLSAQVLSARPNAAHLALAELERKKRLLGIVTQNFDGLHHDAGEIDPLCPDCGGFLKAATILFGQRVPDEELTRARELALSCDLFLVVGSSLKVTPAATLPRLALKNDVPLIIINLQPTPFDDYAEIVINEKAGVVLPPLVSSV